MDQKALQAMCDRSRLHRDLTVKLSTTATGIRVDATVPALWLGDGEPVHGGILAVLVDTAAAFALISASGRDWSTVDLRVDYLYPVLSPHIWVQAEVLHVGRTLGRVICRLGAQTESAAAIATATFRSGSSIEESEREG